MTAPTAQRRQLLEAEELLPGDVVLETSDELVPGATITRAAQAWPSETGEDVELQAELDGMPAWVTLHGTDSVVVAERPHLHQQLAIAWRYASTNDATGAAEYAALARADVAELERRLELMVRGAYDNAERLRVQHVGWRDSDTARPAEWVQADKRRSMELAKAHAYADALALLRHTTTTDQLEAEAERRLAAGEH